MSSLKRTLMEGVVYALSAFAPRASNLPENPRSIFVLRNNDVGDLLVVTPLFEALRRRYPKAKIVAGVGAWNLDVLRDNPFVDEVLPISAPWYNQQIRPQGVSEALRYVISSEDVRRIAAHKFDIGIDVLGSQFGSLLMMRAGIPFRLGVRGYAGGHSAAQRFVDFNPHEHVGRSALRFAELLGAQALPENRPQLFLPNLIVPGGKIVIAPGGGFPGKCWPVDNFVQLVGLLKGQKVCVVGGKLDVPLGARLASAGDHVEDFTGKTDLRGAFEMIGASRLVICNSSMAMHASAAFRVPAVVLLGEYFDSASRHAAQWGYPESVVLGKEPSHPEVYSPQEVLAKLEGLLSGSC